MAIRLDGSSSLAGAGNLVATFPMTVFFWMKNIGNAASINIFSSYHSASASALSITRLANFNYNTIYVRDTGYSASRTTSSVGSTTWAPCMVVLDTSVLRKYFLIADVSGLNNAHALYSTLSNHDNWHFVGMNGDVAELAVWNSALGDAEWASLKAGALPESVSPGTLVDAWSLQTLGAYTGVNGRSMTASGTVVQGGAHPITRTAAVVLSGVAELAGMTADGGMLSVSSALAGEVVLTGITGDGGMGRAVQLVF